MQEEVAKIRGKCSSRGFGLVPLAGSMKSWDETCSIAQGNGEAELIRM